MSRWKSAIAAAVAVGMSGSTFAAVAFTPGDLVVYRVGDGSAALSNAATAVFLDEYTTGGTLAQSIALPTASGGGNNAVTASGTATSEGLITLSADGHSLIFSGYAAAPGTAGIAGTSTGGATPVLRAIGTAAPNGTLNTSTTTTAFSANNIRGVTSTDGITLFASGANTGVITMSLGGSGAGTVVSNTFTNLRQLGIFNGQLYVSAGAGALRMGSVGSGVPTTTGQTTTSLPGFSTSTGSPYGFYFADLSASVAGLDTLYVSDDGSIASGGGIQKYSLVGGNWTLNGTIGSGTTTPLGVRGLTGAIDAGGAVDLFASSGASGAANTSFIYSVIDTAGYNAAPSTTTATSIATATTNEAFRGIAFAPTAVPEPASLGLVAMAGGLLLGRRRRA